MKRLLAGLGWALGEFGPLVVFWVLMSFGLKIAIGGSIIYILGDAIRRRWRGLPFTRLYLLSSTLTVVFGTVDLFAATPFMLKYEAVITNAATGAAFVLGARGPRPMLLELAEHSQNRRFPDRADVRRFFQLFTLLWAAYFFLKAALYLLGGALLPLTQAMALRSVLGGVSLALMIVLSTTQGPRLFALCRRLGLLPEEPHATEQA